MNDIFMRRSCRSFLDKEVKMSDLKEMLYAAMQAPSAMRQIPWHFVIVDKKEIPTLFGNVVLTIPEGTNTGDKQRIKGKGINKGDMYIIMDVRVPKKLSRDQKKLFEELEDTDMDDTVIKDFDKFTEKNDR